MLFVGESGAAAAGTQCCRPRGRNVNPTFVFASQATASSLAFNASEPGFAPADVAPLLQGDFAGAYPAAAASHFASLVNGTAAGGRTLQQLIANLSSGSVRLPEICAATNPHSLKACLFGVSHATLATVKSVQCWWTSCSGQMLIPMLSSGAKYQGLAYRSRGAFCARGMAMAALRQSCAASGPP